MLVKANEFIKRNKDKVNQEFRLNYHYMAPIGWMNDPNGFSFFGNQYHLFYQSNPYDAKWDCIYWGHATTKDFIRWKDEEVALAPDQLYDAKGCFSGTAMEVEGKHYLIYTAVHKENNKEYQEQAMAVSDDGINYRKLDCNPVIPNDLLPSTVIPNDFRDPKIWIDNGIFHCIVAAKDEKLGARMLLFQSRDLMLWELKGDFIKPDRKHGIMWECPDYFILDGQNILLMSVIKMPKEGYRYWNKQSCVYLLGKLSDKRDCLQDYSFEEIDYGYDFYAPQTLLAKDGRRIMIAWMQAWEDSIPTQELNHGWAGAMTLPRELSIKDGRLIQTPVTEIKSYRTDEVCYQDVIIDNTTINIEKVFGSSIELDMEVDMSEADNFTINMFETKNYRVTLAYDKNNEELIFDRSKAGHKIISTEFEKPEYRVIPVKLINGRLKLRIFIDTSSLEIFVQEGITTITSRVYPVEKEYGISFAAEGLAKITQVNKWSINL